MNIKLTKHLGVLSFCQLLLQELILTFPLPSNKRHRPRRPLGPPSWTARSICFWCFVVLIAALYIIFFLRCSVFFQLFASRAHRLSGCSIAKYNDNILALFGGILDRLESKFYINREYWASKIGKSVFFGCSLVPKTGGGSGEG